MNSNPTFTSEAPLKPLLRGSSHQAAFFFALGAGLMLIAVARTTQSRVASIVYCVGLAGDVRNECALPSTSLGSACQEMDASP